MIWRIARKRVHYYYLPSSCISAAVPVPLHHIVGTNKIPVIIIYIHVSWSLLLNHFPAGNLPDALYYNDTFSCCSQDFYFFCKLFMKCSQYSKVQYHVAAADFFRQELFVLFLQVIYCMLNLQWGDLRSHQPNQSFKWDHELRSTMCIRMQKGHIHTLKMLLSMSEFGSGCANTKIIQHALKVPDSESL